MTWSRGALVKLGSFSTLWRKDSLVLINLFTVFDVFVAWKQML